jgi:hypothetical protein
MHEGLLGDKMGKKPTCLVGRLCVCAVVPV